MEANAKAGKFPEVEKRPELSVVPSQGRENHELSQEDISHMAQVAVWYSNRGYARVASPAPLTAEQRIAAETDALVKEDIRAALTIHVVRQLGELDRGGKLQNTNMLSIPKVEKYSGLIEVLRQNKYLASETDNTVELDLTGRILAGLIVNKSLPDLARRYLGKPHNQVTRQVVGEEIEKYVYGSK